MKIQLALDRLTAEECLTLIEETSASIDWIEVGTGVIKEYGMSIVRDIKARYPQMPILADMKTCDAGKHEAIQAFEAGADIMTVMAFSSDQTIVQTLEVAKKYNKRIMIDLLGVKSRQRIEELVALGVELVCLHIGKDMQKEGELASDELFHLVEGFDGLEVAIAGGIDAVSAKKFKNSLIQILIVGSAITASANPKAASEEIVQAISY